MNHNNDDSMPVTTAMTRTTTQTTIQCDSNKEDVGNNDFYEEDGTTNNHNNKNGTTATTTITTTARRRRMTMTRCRTELQEEPHQMNRTDPSLNKNCHKHILILWLEIHHQSRYHSHISSCTYQAGTYDRHIHRTCMCTHIFAFYII